MKNEKTKKKPTAGAKASNKQAAEEPKRKAGRPKKSVDVAATVKAKAETELTAPLSEQIFQPVETALPAELPAEEIKDVVYEYDEEFVAEKTAEEPKDLIEEIAEEKGEAAAAKVENFLAAVDDLPDPFSEGATAEDDGFQPDEAFLEQAVIVGLAETAANRAEDALSETSLQLQYEAKDALNAVRALSPEEKTRLSYYEERIAEGLKTYVTIGKYLFAIWHERLHEGEFSSWKDYVKTKWNMSSSGAFDLMKAFKTWRLASSGNLSFAEAVAPTRWLAAAEEPEAEDGGEILNGEPVFETPTDSRISEKPKPQAPAFVSDADAPSQRAIEELGRVSGFLSKQDLSEKEFQEFETVATRSLWTLVREFSPNGKFTQKIVAEAMDAFLEWAKVKAFEVDGKHYAPTGAKVSAGEFRITRGLFEKLMAEKAEYREEMEARRKRMSAPQERKNEDFSFVPTGEDEPPTIFMQCSCGQAGSQTPYRFAFAAFQMLCGHYFGKSKDSAGFVFNPKLTADNPIPAEDLPKAEEPEAAKAEE